MNKLRYCIYIYIYTHYTNTHTHTHAHHTVVLISLYTPCRMCNMLIIEKIRGIMKIACYFLFSTILNKLFHITDVYIYSTRQNNNWINKKYPIQKFTYPWIMSFPGWSMTVFIFCDSCSWVPCLSWAVCPEVQFEPLTLDCMIWKSIF